ncbi:helix-turn-helix domain-containing protein [Saccharopolyspora rhizosphaerae]|uniref:Helix-turn-helix domain-containing protein n=1 Tax=Saccharopolyspora rhizosphaerae TaxID=2492662 RepID=A0A3R8QUU3_9PSEU|nr:helix-turn-helix domain-containing protein [Saccharopolyspora rhizosphaerae]
MGTSMSKSGRRDFYSLRRAAWILNLHPSSISRAIRVGELRAERRNGRLAIPASELTRLLAGTAAYQGGGRK